MSITQTLLQFPQQFFDNDGTPLSGGTLTFYVGGTVNTLQNTYSDQALTVLNDNPITLNSAGFPIVSNTEVKIYPLAAAYKIVVKDSSGVVKHTWDNVEPNAPWNLSNGASLTGVTLVSPILSTSLITTSALLAGICEGRLTGTSASPVSDTSNITTIYFTPYKGNNIGLYDGSSKWTVLPFTEVSIALGTLTSGLPYDLFAYNNSGAVALRSPVAWTNTTTRATALVLQNGIWVKTGATTDRYLGTFYTTSTTQTQDTATQRYVWNYYNRVPRVLRKQESTANWPYTSATIRQADGAAGNQVEIVVGVAEVMVRLSVSAVAANSAGTANVAAGIGEDSTTAFASEMLGGWASTAVASQFFALGARLDKTPAIGRHYYAWLEAGAANNTFYGLSAGFTGTQAGLSGSIDG